ncbi:MAG: Rpn family recombination-promoting nuclease/putative transposase [Prevotella sp.]|nr:Rpn family recombination-promoting nuclease/putative transposase [Prevotella sp.]
MMVQERYINPYTDFGFKKLFGTEMNKDLLISFLNALFGDSKQEIVDVEYLNSEHLGDGYGDRRAVFDVYCKTADGSRFIVEMQRAHQDYFKDRSLYYSTFAIREQAPKGKEWDYQLEDVYTIGVLNFTFPDDEYPADKFFHQVKLKDVDDNHVFYDKLTLIYLEMPKFHKTEDELVTMFDKWMFVLCNLSRLLDRPKALQDRVFKKLFEQAEIARYNPEERREYEASLKNFWDYYSTITSALNKGRAEGREEGRAEGLAEGRAEGEEKIRNNARNMKADGMALELIAKYTGLTTEEIAEL